MAIPPHGSPDLSLVMPCYNEEVIVGSAISRLLTAFARAGHRLELIAVDNGSTDRTGAVIRRLAAADGAVVPHRVEQNQGYGHGILSGLPLCTAPWVGIVPADAQVDPEDVVRLFEAACAADRSVLAKVRRCFRTGGLSRRLFTFAYNLLIRCLWPGLRSFDVNGTPKLLPAAVARAMRLTSKGWLLDAEIMVKAKRMGVRLLERNVFDRQRSGGRSHVRLATCWELLWGVVKLRLCGAGPVEPMPAGADARLPLGVSGYLSVSRQACKKPALDSK